ncbi:50S ribosomal protein L22 [bacterium]|nr:50S ribosomal protein L22 [bacterium]MBT3581170.1 50S ribosomal protein L22 [bacterium]MBT4551603.1 50S ribosomal protein L22 [bacterium]MBT5988189.1 50S ribosomal protein L22 [bacterium]
MNKKEVKNKEVYAKTGVERISPYKLRRIANIVRGKKIKEAVALLKFVPNKGALVIQKLLKSVVANAVHNDNLNEEKLYVSHLVVNEGIRMKRFQPKSKGRVYQIIKRSSKAIVAVKEKEGDK